MKNKQACFSHQSDIWETPKKYYNNMMARGWFDPCPINPKFDGLRINWHKKNFVNPPYSQIKEWVDKAIEEHKKGHEIILFVPARTDTKWFEKLFYYGAEFNFITGRIKFSGKQGAPFPSVVIELTGKESWMTLIPNEIYND